ncbi:MAG: SH3 domain-containing protein, partial [Rhizomicrobium sp.]
QATQEHMRLGTLREGPATRWQPLTNTRPVGDEPRQSLMDKSNSKLLRDVGVVVMAAAAAVLLLPKMEAMLPNNIRWQIETVGGMFVPVEPAPVHAVQAPAAATQPKTDHPVKYAARSINVRVQPSTTAGIATNLKRGAAVSVLETRGNWDRVEIAVSQGPAIQGWIFNSYLADADPTAAQPAATASAATPVFAPMHASVPAPAPEVSVSATPAAAVAEPAPTPAEAVAPVSQ